MAAMSILVDGIYTANVTISPLSAVTILSTAFVRSQLPHRRQQSSRFGLAINGGPCGSFTVGLDCSVSPHLSSDICLGLDWKASVREWLISLGERPTSGFESKYLKALDPVATVLHLCPQDTVLGSVTPSVTVNNTSSDPRAPQVPLSGTTLPVPPRFAYAQTDFACARSNLSCAIDNLSSAIDTVQNNAMFTIDHYNSMLRSTPNVPTHESASVNAPLQGPSSVRRVSGPVPFLPDVGLDTLFLSSDPLQNVLCSLVVL
ncbi:hypothetical protein B0H13DRAFT_1850909 [Mycena leptocephala]|nr:hypothetical protein B0H13DRAFT_1850909 [Mycena leptocephala]